MIREATALLLAVLMAACGGPENEARQHNAEVARLRSNNVEVVLLADRPALPQGRASFTLEFRSAADGTQLVDVGAVKATATMPMPGMSPMFGTVSVEPAEVPGRYRGTADLTMAGEWRLAVAWDGPAGSGQVRFSPAVQ